MKLNLSVALSVALGVALAGCDFAGSPPAENGGAPRSYAALPTHRPFYGIGFYNDTEGKLTAVRCEFVIVGGGAYRSAVGYLVPHAQKQNGGGPDPIPAEGTVFWTTTDGVEHSQRVSLTAGIKNQWWFDGTIWLKISNGGVVVEPVTKAESLDPNRPAVP